MSFLNRFEPRYSHVSPLIRRWAKELLQHTDKFRDELDALPPLPVTEAHNAASGYIPYLLKDAECSSRRRLYTVVSTFTGGGGSDIGFELAGGHVLGGSDFVPEAQRTFRRNFPRVRLDTRDIRRLSRSQAEVDAWLATLGVRVGKLDVLAGSPPCSEFSVAGRGVADQAVLKRYSDVKQNNIATLPFDFAELALRIRPKIIVMENVPSLATRAPHLFSNLMNMLRLGEI